MIYFLNDISSSEFKESRVKSFLRKGRVVRSHKRKTKKSRIVHNTAIFAGILGLPAVTYLALRGRYRANMFKSLVKAEQKSLSLNIPIPPNAKSVTFTINGFTGQRGLARTSIKFRKKIQSLIPDTHAIAIDTKLFNTYNKVNKKENPILWNINQAVGIPKILLSTSVKKGYNPITEDLLSQILAVKRQNPNIKINIIGASGGGLPAREVSELLTFKNIDHKYATLGSPYLGITKPSKSGIDFEGKEDFLMKSPIKSPNFVILNDMKKGHAASKYLESPKFQELLKELFSDKN